MLGNNMFAYCRNSPVANMDSSGLSCVSAFADESYSFAPTADSISGGGAVATAIITCVVVGGLCVAEKYIDKYKFEIEAKLKASLAVAKKRTYKTEYETHHIAARKSPNAAHAAAILNEVLSGGVEDPLNKVELKTSVHRRIQTTLYYSLVNHAIISAYSKANGDKQQQYSNVVKVLDSLSIFLSALNVLSIN